MVDNTELILPFVPEVDDGDTFIYTEMLDRGKKKGNNGQRLVKTFFHRSREEFLEPMPTIRKLCDLAGIRACTRLAPRSYKSVAAKFLMLVTETYITQNYAGMKSLYNRALGTTGPLRKHWIWDMDELGDETDRFGGWLEYTGRLQARIPSKKGVHFISPPFNVQEIPREVIPGSWKELQLHKDNPTNLYIPDGAD